MSNICEFCRSYPCKDPRCPNYIPLKPAHYCSICNGGILNGEEYTENSDGEYAHYDCLFGESTRNVIEWFGGEIRTMDEEG